MKIRIPLSENTEAKIILTSSNNSTHYLTKQLTTEEFDTLMSSLEQQRRAITGGDEKTTTYRFGKTVTIDGGIGAHKITVEPGGVKVGEITVPSVESEWEPGVLVVAKPTTEQLNRLAQKFYTASGLSLSAFDKPNIIQGLAAVFDMEVD